MLFINALEARNIVGNLVKEEAAKDWKSVRYHAEPVIHSQATMMATA